MYTVPPTQPDNNDKAEALHVSSYSLYTAFTRLIYDRGAVVSIRCVGEANEIPLTSLEPISVADRFLESNLIN